MNVYICETRQFCAYESVCAHLYIYVRASNERCVGIVALMQYKSLNGVCGRSASFIIFSGLDVCAKMMNNYTFNVVL